MCLFYVNLQISVCLMEYIIFKKNSLYIVCHHDPDNCIVYILGVFLKTYTVLKTCAAG